MQLNPSTDLYDDDDDNNNKDKDDENNDDDDGDDDDDESYTDYPDDYDDQYENVNDDVGNTDAGDRNNKPEILPEAKYLTQLSQNENNLTSPQTGDDELKSKTIVSISHYNVDEGDLEDMGYDEDDEKFNIPKPKVSSSRQYTRFTDDTFNHNYNAEGSGNHYKRNHHNQHHTSHTEYINKYRRQHEQEQHKMISDINTDNGGGSSGGIRFGFIDETEVDMRESSGNFANDDEDNDDDEDDDSDDDNMNNNHNHNNHNDNGSEGFFNTHHRKPSNGHYFRKNVNDAIKIISTPLGKVGIVYQQSPNNNNNDGNEKSTSENDGGAGSTNSNGNANKKKTFTDFDALSPDPESSHRLASSHPKITPVLTPDGKVALLYRGDSENTKYEPFRNLTTHTHAHHHQHHQHENKNSNQQQTSFIDNLDNNNNNKNNGDSASISDQDYDISLNGGGDSENDNDNSDNLGNNRAFPLKITATESKSQAEILQAPDIIPTTGSFIIRPTDSVLPMINRPLSEVLGIKKNQFKQFRIKDAQQMAIENGGIGRGTATATTETMAKQLVKGIGDTGTGATTVHFLTKVNLADYPTSSITRSRNFDFDFSRDNTMLDERSRHRQQQQQIKDMLNGGTSSSSSTSINQQKKLDDIANDEVLSKTEIVNLAIIPHFDDELERLQRLREYEGRRHHHRQRHRNKQNPEDLSGVHCIMQIMMGIAAISTVFGMLGTFFKQRILDQIRLMHW